MALPNMCPIHTCLNKMVVLNVSTDILLRQVKLYYNILMYLIINKHWTHAFKSVVYVINSLPLIHTHPITPYEKLFHVTPTYNELKVFDSLCYSWLLPYNKDKLALHSTPSIF